MKKSLLSCLLVLTLVTVAWIAYIGIDRRLAFGHLESPFFRACQSDDGLVMVIRDVAKGVGAEVTLGYGWIESYQARYAGSRIAARMPLKIRPEECDRFVDDLFARLDAELVAKSCTILDRQQTDHSRKVMGVIDYNTRWVEGEILIVPVARQDGMMEVVLTIHENRAKRLGFL